jgi:hypothetical protein
MIQYLKAALNVVIVYVMNAAYFLKGIVKVVLSRLPKVLNESLQDRAGSRGGSV